MSHFYTKNLKPFQPNSTFKISPYCADLDIGEEITVDISDMNRINGELTIYSGSRDQRYVIGQILQTEGGKQAWKKILEKLKSSKLVKMDVSYSPIKSEAPEIAEVNYPTLIGTFLRSLTLDTVAVDFKALEKSRPRPSSLDSVPTKGRKL